MGEQYIKKASEMRALSNDCTILLKRIYKLIADLAKEGEFHILYELESVTGKALTDVINSLRENGYTYKVTGFDPDTGELEIKPTNGSYDDQIRVSIDISW